MESTAQPAASALAQPSTRLTLLPQQPLHVAETTAAQPTALLFGVLLSHARGAFKQCHSCNHTGASIPSQNCSSAFNPSHIHPKAPLSALQSILFSHPFKAFSCSLPSLPNWQLCWNHTSNFSLKKKYWLMGYFFF